MTISQLGSDIDGEAAEDGSGYSVSLSGDGSRVAIGAPFNDDAGNNAGQVRVFRWDGSAWTQLGADIDGDASRTGSDADNSGLSVSLSSDGSLLAVGAPYAYVEGSFTKGRVRVYRWDDDTSVWVQVGGDMGGEAAQDLSGFSVSLSPDGSRVAIGASNNDGNGNRAGHVRVYEFDGVNGDADGVDGWTQVGGDIDGEAAGDRSGSGVSLSADGSRVAIGAPRNGGNGDRSGHVRVYQYDSAGSAWTQVGGDIDGEAEGDLSGGSVSLSADGSRVAIGAQRNDGTSADADDDRGHVRVYDWDGVNWVQVGGDIDGEAAGDRSGLHVSLTASGSRVAIGAPFSSDERGYVRVYDWDGSTWTQAGDDVDGQAAGDRAGFSVSLSPDGSRVAVGAPKNDGNGSDAGHVRIYSIAADAAEVVADVAPRLAVSCVPQVLTVGATVTCTVTGGGANIDILWRASHGTVFAGVGVTLDESGVGEFTFVVPAAALGQEVTVELVDWLAPLSLGVVGGPVPTSVPSGEGPTLPGWPAMVGLVAVVGAAVAARRGQIPAS